MSVFWVQSNTVCIENLVTQANLWCCKPAKALRVVPPPCGEQFTIAPPTHCGQLCSRRGKKECKSSSPIILLTNSATGNRHNLQHSLWNRWGAQWTVKAPIDLGTLKQHRQGQKTWKKNVDPQQRGELPTRKTHLFTLATDTNAQRPQEYKQTLHFKATVVTRQSNTRTH